ncbi:unnamed protein product [Staurois parvus]|uniref:Uncharacterized protein n=1 Tax=Staurois parvus TaxID=386267 RepID=A0ABN9EBY1_9NEOB|nr:unnamed protein product [Staurois parvus]
MGPGLVGAHEMPLLSCFIGFFGVGKDTGAPWLPIARGPHELSVRP